MEIINSFYKKETINCGRQKNVDLLKAISILFMVFCNTIETISTNTTSFWYSIAHNYLGSYLGIAHAFMLCMGIGIVYSHNSSPKRLIIRGIKFIILGYLLDFFREGIFILILSGFSKDFFYATFLSDILAFAGVANILVGILKKCKLNSLYIFLISLVLSIAGSFIYNIECGGPVQNVIIGYFFNTGAEGMKDTVDSYSCFTLFSWFIFVALGMLLGDILKRCTDLKKLYSKLTIVGLIISIAYFIAIAVCGVNYLNPLNSKYSISTLDAMGFIGIDFFMLGIFYFIAEKVNSKHLQFAFMTANNILIVYILHWLLISLITCVSFILDFEPSLFVLYILSLANWLISSLLSIPISKFIAKKCSKKKTS